MKNKIRLFRAIFKLTQKQLAKEVGISNISISFIENQTKTPKITTAMKIANVFGKEVEDVFILDEN